MVILARDIQSDDGVANAAIAEAAQRLRELEWEIAGLLQSRGGKKLHVIPLGGMEPVHHASLGCWCQPLLADAGTMAIHHAKDGREKMERQNIMAPHSGWGHVYEDTGRINT
jgi:hypothetical protein